MQAQVENGNILYSSYATGGGYKYPTSYIGPKHPYDVDTCTDIPTGSEPSGNTTAYPSAENDYFHTLHKQNLPSSSGHSESMDTYKDDRAAREHIYESPQFKRRYGDTNEPQGMVATERQADNDVSLAYYYEIDPCTNNTVPPANNNPRGNNMAT